MMKRLLAVSLCLPLLAGCDAVINEVSSAVSEPAAEHYDTSRASKVDLSALSEDLTINRPGTYVLSGTLNGSVIVDCGGEAVLLLDGAEIHTDGFASIYIADADRTVIHLEEGSSNTILNTGTVYTQRDDNKVDAAIFSKDDLVISGNGSLKVESQVHGIVGKDAVQIQGGSVSVEAERKGIVGKDSLTVECGMLSVSSGGDGLSSNNSEDPGMGNVSLNGGEITVVSGGDAVYAAGMLQVKGGTMDFMTLNSSSYDSFKGLKADGTILLEGGSAVLNCADDAIHSNSDITINGGSYEISTDDDGIHADGSLTINDGDILIHSSYEGLEARLLEVNGGTIEVNAQDDGLNAASSEGGRMQDVSITINGGTVIVNAGGDGLDSNSQIQFNGGSVLVDGPSDSMNAPIDWETNGYMNGGEVFAIGSSGMMEQFSADSKQVSLMYGFETVYPSGTEVVLKKNGTELYRYTARKSFSCIVYSSPELEIGDSIEILLGNDSYTAELTSKTGVFGTIGRMGGGFHGGMKPGMAPPEEGGMMPPEGMGPGAEGRPENGGMGFHGPGGLSEEEREKMMQEIFGEDFTGKKPPEEN